MYKLCFIMVESSTRSLDARRSDWNQGLQVSNCDKDWPSGKHPSLIPLRFITATEIIKAINARVRNAQRYLLLLRVVGGLIVI